MGDSAAIAAGIRFAARKRVDIINLSFESSSSVRRREIPEIIDALRFARRKVSLVVARVREHRRRCGRIPGPCADVLSVGATTEHGAWPITPTSGRRSTSSRREAVSTRRSRATRIAGRRTSPDATSSR